MVAMALTSTTRDRPAGGYDQKVGFGTVDAAAALAAAATTAGHSPAQAGAATTLHFGGGAAAVLAVALITPRGAAGLVVACLFALAFLVATGLAGEAAARACGGPCRGGTMPQAGRRSRSGPARRFTPPGRTGRIRAWARSRP